MFKILIVEDDTRLVSLLKEHLHKFGYTTQSVDDFETVRDQFEDFDPHLVLLDINLPKYDGYYWCRQFRSLSTCPIIFISARDGKMDQVMALENGADDYITKPFDYEIAMAKIKSQLRRAYAPGTTNGRCPFLALRWTSSVSPCRWIRLIPSSAIRRLKFWTS